MTLVSLFLLAVAALATMLALPIAHRLPARQRWVLVGAIAALGATGGALLVHTGCARWGERWPDLSTPECKP